MAKREDTVAPPELPGVIALRFMAPSMSLPQEQEIDGPIQSSVSAFVEKNLWEVLACLRSGGHRLFRRESALADKRFIAPAVAGVAQVCVVQFLVYQRMEGASDWQP